MKRGGSHGQGRWHVGSDSRLPVELCRTPTVADVELDSLCQTSCEAAPWAFFMRRSTLEVVAPAVHTSG